MNEEIETLETLSDTPVEPAAPQMPANTIAPALSVPDTPHEGPAAPIAKVASSQASIDPTAATGATAAEAKAEAASINLDIPDASKTGAVVKVNDSDGDGIPDSNEGSQAELISSAELAQVDNVKKSKTKIKINFGKKTMPFSLALILAVLTLIIGISVGGTMFSTTIYNNTYNPLANDATNARVVDGKNNTTIAGNYTFKVPEKYYYDRENKGLLVYDTGDTFRIFLRGQEGVYEDIANAKTSVKATMVDKGIQVISIKEVKINKHPYIVAETIDGLTNRLIAFTSANETDIFYIEIVTTSNNYSYEALDLADDILTNAAFKDKKSEMEGTKVNDIASLVISASQVYKSLNN